VPTIDTYITYIHLNMMTAVLKVIL